MRIEIDEFYEMLNELNKILKSYVTEKSLLALWVGELTSSIKSEKKLSEEFSKLVRILSRKFYK